MGDISDDMINRQINRMAPEYEERQKTYKKTNMKTTLKHVTTEQLLQELEERKTLAKETKDILHIGIIDSEGLDSIVATPDSKRFCEIHHKLGLRARFNTGRNPVLFAIKIPEIMAKLIKGKPVVEAAEFVQDLSNYQVLGY